MAQTLEKSIGLFRGTALFLSIVIGAGLLTLPGLAVQVAGDHALIAWIACGLAALPFLTVFIVLGQRYPEAGGISAYARRAFGGLGADIAGILFLGAVIFGLPSIALVGGHYFSAVTGTSAHASALILLASALLPHLSSGTGAARVTSVVASTVLAAIIGFLLLGFAGLPNRITLPTLFPENFSWHLAMAPMMMLFFAFTGWEVGAGAAEEFKNPQRDYPLAMILSFALATTLYITIAVLVQQVDLAGHYEAPFIVIITPLLGPFGGTLVAIVAVTIIYANLAGAIWGVSRMVFGLARDGSLPAALAETSNDRPLRAVFATLTVFMAVVAVDWVGDLGLKTMLSLSGQNFVVLFGIAAFSLFVLAKSGADRLLAGLVGLSVVIILSLQAKSLLYPGILVALVVARHSLQVWTKRKISN